MGDGVQIFLLMIVISVIAWISYKIVDKTAPIRNDGYGPRKIISTGSIWTVMMIIFAVICFIVLILSR